VPLRDRGRGDREPARHRPAPVQRPSSPKRSASSFTPAPTSPASSATRPMPRPGRKMRSRGATRCPAMSTPWCSCAARGTARSRPERRS
jgi:hypothetical protein